MWNKSNIYVITIVGYYFKLYKLSLPADIETFLISYTHIPKSKARFENSDKIVSKNGWCQQA